MIADLKYTGNFTRQDISQEYVSQIIRAGYGCTPHTTYNGRGGLTVPFWCAEYYLTGNIYVVDQDGVFRYHNQNPGSDLTTRDYRLQFRKQLDSDVTKDTYSVRLRNSEHKKENL